MQGNVHLCSRFPVLNEESGVLTIIMAELYFSKLRPNFLPDEWICRSEVWDKDLRFEKGERIQLHGPSGRGKSTALKILFGLEHQFSGEVRCGEQSVIRAGTPPAEHLPRRRSGFSAVFQAFYLFSHLTGWENLQTLPPPASGDRPSLSRERLHQFAGDLNLADILDRSTEHYSPGQKQRLALLRAIARPFDWLLLDEPFSHIDEANVRTAIEVIEAALTHYQAGLFITSLNAEPQLPGVRGLAI